ncbi:MAG: nucleotidyltransferase domain-containing protein [Phycisphaerae bacterium]
MSAVDSVRPSAVRDLLVGPVDAALLGRVVERITSVFPRACIVLFGSHAYGTPRSESDVDLLVISEAIDDAVFRAASRVYGALSPRAIPVDVVFMTPEQFRRRRGGFDPFLIEIVERGRVLHGEYP